MNLSIKKLLLLSTLIFVSTFANAAIERFYTGYSFTTGGGELTQESPFGEAEYDIDSTQNQFKLGMQFQSGVRMELGFAGDINAKTDGTEIEYSGYDVDWRFPFSGKSFKPFLGVGLGYYTYEGSNINGEELTGFAGNLMAGLLFPVHEQIELEVAFLSKTISWRDIEATNGFTTVTIETRSTMQSLLLSGRFFF